MHPPSLRFRHGLLTLVCLASWSCTETPGIQVDPDEGGTRPAPRGKGDVIGEDDRLERHQIATEGPEERFAQASAGLVFTTRLTPLGGGSYRFADSVQTAARRYELCEGERFEEQPVVMRCSATLVAPDLILTAGHCIGLSFETEEDMARVCKLSHAIFDVGYAKPYDDAFEEVRDLDAEDVYDCEHVEARGRGDGGDWALLRLSRPVEGRSPMVMSPITPEEGAALTVIGHPFGLPQKIARGHVVEQDTWQLRHDVDTLRGNSGSGVFAVDAEDALVGVHVQGTRQEDLMRDPDLGCQNLRACRVEDGCDASNGAITTTSILSTLEATKPNLHAELTGAR